MRVCFFAFNSVKSERKQHKVRNAFYIWFSYQKSYGKKYKGLLFINRSKTLTVFAYMQEKVHISTYTNKFMHNFGKNVKKILIKHCEMLFRVRFLLKTELRIQDYLYKIKRYHRKQNGLCNMLYSFPHHKPRVLTLHRGSAIIKVRKGTTPSK